MSLMSVVDFGSDIFGTDTDRQVHSGLTTLPQLFGGHWQKDMFTVTACTSCPLPLPPTITPMRP